MRLQHSAEQVGAFPSRVLGERFAQETRPSDSVASHDEGEPFWDPVKAAGGIALIAILCASAWLEWQAAKWVFSLFV
jgi:hypothetical protein